MKRNSNVEGLRLLTMVLIVLFHLMGRVNYQGKGTFCSDMVYNIFSSWGIVGVNVFVMISSWFLAENHNFNTKRIVDI